MSIEENLAYLPLSPTTWNDLEILFGEKGACGGCWCLYWREKSSVFERQKGAGNKRALKEIVDTGHPTGILSYCANQPVGWCAIAPREVFKRLENSRILKRIDEKVVWSITCLFIDKKFRRKGISTGLIKAAVNFAFTHGASIVESYPVEPQKGEMPSVFAWTGIASAYRKAGFHEVARRSISRPIMRILKSDLMTF